MFFNFNATLGKFSLECICENENIFILLCLIICAALIVIKITDVVKSIWLKKLEVLESKHKDESTNKGRKTKR